MTALFLGLFFLWVVTASLYLFERGERKYHQKESWRYMKQYDKAIER